jgi:hypothetical protein
MLSIVSCPLGGRLGLALVLLTVFLPGCSDQPTDPGTPSLQVASITGRYSISRINGQRLPFTACAGESKVRSGSLRLRWDNTFIAYIRHSTPPAAPAETLQETGRYAREPGTNTIRFTSATRPGVTWEGTVLSDGALRIIYPVCGTTYRVRLVPSS